MPTSTSAVSTRTSGSAGQPVGHHPHRLGAQPLPAERRGQPVADLLPPLVVRRSGGAAVADHPAVVGQGDEPAAVVRPAVLHPHPQPVGGVGVRVARREVEARVAAVEQGAGLVHGLRHEDDAVGPQGRFRSGATGAHRRRARPRRTPTCSLGSAGGEPGVRLGGRAAARRHRQGRHRQDHGGRRARPGAGRRGPADAARRGRGPPGHRAALRLRRRCPTRSARSPSAPGGGDVFALADRPRGGAARVPRHVLPARAGRARRCAGSAPSTSRRRSRPGMRDVLLTGKVYEAVRRRKGSSARVRRGGARRAADRADRPLPQRQRGGRGAGPGRADPRPGRLDHDAAAQPEDRGAPRDPARGDAGAGDRRRRRRAGQGRAAGRRHRRQHGARAAAQAGRARPRPPRAGSTAPSWPTGSTAAGVRRCRDPGVDALLVEAARARATGSRWRRASAGRSRRCSGRRTTCRCSPTASTSARSTSSPEQLCRQGMA